MKLSTVVLLVFSLLLTTGVKASGYKCSNGFVTVGDRKATVLLICGDPFFAEVV